MKKNKDYDPSKTNTLYVLMMAHATKKKAMTSMKEVGRKSGILQTIIIPDIC